MMRWFAIALGVLWGCGEETSPPSAGAACTRPEALVCAGSQVLQCDAERYGVVHACPGQQACAAWAGDRVACGTEALRVFHAMAESPCTGDGAQVCDFTRDRVLECIDGRWAVATECGPERCVSGGRPDAPSAACAAGSLSPGGRCAFESGMAACSTDGSAVLTCRGGETVIDEDCAADARRCGQVPCGDDVCIGCR